ncbi:carbon storage regulator CsrA [Desulforamulus putei]|uniref:Translational regulator CsrA n=1 Tax=Desulforamulus putei DSM 12395 TaxID=1121429 RepID=A0A1M5B562_9FIRM|nr:carbon storage regulator CsrA [Desulforamulus putei]SHF37619.1 carbon storage regulator, CsrA [Desulforamulus putei DSM 12395]
MLILSRKKNEAIHIGDNIIVTILDVSGETIKIGIDAPKNIQIFRSEVLNAIQQENKQAASYQVNMLEINKLLGKESIRREVQ